MANKNIVGVSLTFLVVVMISLDCLCSYFHGLNRKLRVMLTFIFLTTDKRITRVTGGAATDWIVIDDLTPSVCTTCARTWVGTALVHAGFVLRTFGTDHAFGSTHRWRSNIIR